MTPEERDRIMFRISGAWPGRPMPDETLLVWAEHLGPMRYQETLAAVRLLERTKSSRPSLADLHEAYTASLPVRTNSPELERPDDPKCSPEEQAEGLRQVRATLEVLRPKLTAFATRKASRRPRAGRAH